MEKISKKVKIRFATDKAYKKFVNELNEWWPAEYTWSQDTLKEIKIDAKKDGLCTEIGPHGFRCDWGRVTEMTKNVRIVLKWQIGPNREPIPNPENSSDIRLEFKKNGESSTTVEFEHYNFENHGDAGKEYRKMMDGEQGWDYILNKYKKYCED